MNGMGRLPALLEGARKSRLKLRILNLFLGWLIPFNRPHGARILELGKEHVKTTAPYKRKNLNHIRGVHACCIATVAEFSSGLLFLSRLNPSRYRLIMARLEIDYYYQAKHAIIAETRISEQQLKDEILRPLADTDKLLFTQTTEVHDSQQHHIATARVTWQIKRWDAVKTRV
jgi:acyl-coenzyme A thioesterase PaaI-like protein